MPSVSKLQSVRERVRKVKGNICSLGNTDRKSRYGKNAARNLFSFQHEWNFHVNDSILLRVLTETCGFK